MLVKRINKLAEAIGATYKPSVRECSRIPELDFDSGSTWRMFLAIILVMECISNV